MTEPSHLCMECLRRESQVDLLASEVASLREVARRSNAVRELARLVSTLPVDHVELVLDIARRFSNASHR